MDPYVSLSFGGEHKSSKTCSDGHTAPNFFNEQIVLWSGINKRKVPDWTDKVSIKLFDNDFGRDYEIGSAQVRSCGERSDELRIHYLTALGLAVHDWLLSDR